MKHLRWILAAVLTVGITGGCAGLRAGSDAAPSTSFTPVGSELIFSLRHEEESGALTVVLRSGDVVEYENVPAEEVSGLLAAEDRDGYYRERIESVFDGTPLEF